MHLHYLAKHENRTFSLKCCITALSGFNQSLLDFFSLVDLQLIITLLHDSLNLVMAALWNRAGHYIFALCFLLSFFFFLFFLA